ncbi:MAG: chromosomal replication initiator protein DnaA [Phycisphaerae bacterium]|nr:chromosomal replication initiator protein DnaA [Phycisphaerae bacterium]
MAAQKICTIRESVANRIGESRFKTWFGSVVQFDLNDNHLSIQVPNAFVGNWIASNYLSDVEAVARDVVGGMSAVDVRVRAVAAAEPPERPPQPRLATPAPAASPAGDRPARLRGDLDSFVVGPCNQLAYSAAQSVVAAPHEAFRPLFIHGGCGLGKTHLLQGLCNGATRKHPTLRWCYLSGEEFTNEFIWAVKAGRIDQFRARFRRVDLLVIDDIHFLANKKATQQEFLHTFDALEGCGHTVVLSSDRHPRAIATLTETLVSRLMAGMVVEVKPPSYEVRREIVRRRAAGMTCRIAPEILDLVAREVTRNVRELEGALYKLAALASLTREPVTPDLARLALEDYIIPEQRPLEPPDVERVVTEFFGVSRERLHSAARDRTVSLARAIAMYLVRKHTTLSFPEIGRALGKKNHSTVVMAVQRMEQTLAQSGDVRWKTPAGAAARPLAALLAELEGKLERRSQ